MIPYMVGKLAPNSTHFTRVLVKEVSGGVYLRAAPPPKRGQNCDIPPPPIVERLYDTMGVVRFGHQREGWCCAWGYSCLRRLKESDVQEERSPLEHVALGWKR